LVLKVATARFRWHPAYRIVPTRYPSIYIYERVADPSEFEALYALEAMTNDRLRDEAGAIELVPKAERALGPGAGPIMAAFTHLNPLGSRFSDGTYGVFYAAQRRPTAVAETRYHHANFLRATREGPMHLPMRLYGVDINAKLHDLREYSDRKVLDPDSYAASQKLGRELRARGSHGVGYPSVRDPGGECIGLFTPRFARNCRHLAQLLYIWDGSQFTDIYEKAG
jgi:hypothetical protein